MDLSPEAEIFFWIVLAAPGVCFVLWVIHAFVESGIWMGSANYDLGNYLPPPPPRTQEDVIRDSRRESDEMARDARATADAMWRAAQEARRLPLLS